jgi:hypothetical protein
MKKHYLLLLCYFCALTAFCQTNNPDSMVVISEFGLNTNKPIANEDLFVKGQIDASRNYKKYKGAGAGTLITSLVSPLLGLIPAIACSATAPKLTNLNYPDEKLFMQKNYYDGYTKKAKKIKSGKVWKNWGIGLGVNILAVLIISTSR